MADDQVQSGPTTVADYAAVFWRRRWTLLGAVVTVPLIALALSSL